MGGGRGKVGQFFVMSMVMVMVMATTTTAMIDCCLFHDSDGTIAAMIYIFLYSMKMRQRICGRQRE
jgi:hypothetical protein